MCRRLIFKYFLKEFHLNDKQTNFSRFTKCISELQVVESSIHRDHGNNIRHVKKHK